MQTADKKPKNINKGKFTVAVVFLLLLAAVIGLSVLLGQKLFAYADSNLQQIIYAVYSTNDGVAITNKNTNKQIYIAESFDNQEALKQINADREGNVYTLEIELPKTEIQAKTPTAAAYDKSKNQFEYEAAATHFLTPYRIEYEWFFKKSTDAEYVSAGSSYDTKTYYFGENKNIGEYRIKVETSFVFLFDGVLYPVKSEAYSACSITDGQVALDSLPQPEGTYGASINSLFLSDEKMRGVWTYNDNLNQNTVLNAGTHQLKYSLVPNNENYASIESITLSVLIRPATVRVIVDNKSSVEGQAYEELTCRLNGNSVLVNGDTFEDLGIMLEKENGETRGTYKISGIADNPNYEILFVNESNPDGHFSVGGVYTVYPNSLQTTINNNVRITLYNAGGFDLNAQLIATKQSGGLPIAGSGLYSLGRYKLTVINNGEFMSAGDRLVIDELSIAAEYAQFNIGGEWRQIEFADGACEIAGFPSELCFVGFTTLTETAMQWWEIFLIVLGSLLCAVIIIVAVLFILKRKGLKLNKKSNSIKSERYKREAFDYKNDNKKKNNAVKKKR